MLCFHQCIGFPSFGDEEINFAFFPVADVPQLKITIAKLCPHVTEFPKMEGYKVTRISTRPIGCGTNQLLLKLLSPSGILLAESNRTVLYWP